MSFFSRLFSPVCTLPVPQHVACRQFLAAGLPQGSRVLDVGCGHGELLADLTGRGMKTSGVEIDKRLVAECCEKGLSVRHGMAETLPFADGEFDAIVSSVVLPYTDQRKALREFTRVLRPGGVMNLTCHGLGYGLHYALAERGMRIYGLRMLANTLVYSWSGWRLPGFVGDTLCQTGRALQSYARENGLELRETFVVDHFLGQARFIGFRLRKPEAVMTPSETFHEVEAGREFAMAESAIDR